jgi:spoIIIJ-associated protein
MRKNLERMAIRTAKDVAKSGVEAKLEPMNSYERRLIHNVLNDWEDVYTESIGEEPNRCVVIKPREK